MTGRTFAQKSLDLVEGAARDGDSNVSELFYELTEYGGYSIRHQTSGRPSERRQTRHTKGRLEGAAIRSAGDNAFTSIDGFPADVPLPALRTDAEIITDGHVDAALPERQEVRALLDEIVHNAVHERTRTLSAHLQFRLRRTVTIRDNRCISRIQPRATLRVDHELRDRSTGTAVGDVFDAKYHLDMEAAALVTRRAEVAAAHRSQSAPPPEGNLPVVLLGGWSGMWLHEAVGHMLESDTFYEGPFAKRMGKRVAPDFITIVDEPDTVRFDDEGTPAGNRILIENGLLNGVMTDLDQSHRRGLPATGNGRRQDYRYPPLSRQWGVQLRAGNATDQELVHGIATGVAVVSARHANVGPDGSFVIEDAVGFRIDSGHVTEPISGFGVQGDAFGSLSRIELIGKEAIEAQRSARCLKRGQTVDVQIGSPGIRFGSLTVRKDS